MILDITFISATKQVTKFKKVKILTMTQTTKSITVFPSIKGYYSVSLNGKPLSIIKYPSSNPYLKSMTLEQAAAFEVNRIINAK